MAQLSDDCFAFGGALLPVAEMERLIAERIVPVAETETVPLAAARGRVVAQDIVAPINLPPFDNSAVDGFATPIWQPWATPGSGSSTASPPATLRCAG
jgi:molybdopterin molybdotransferase